VRSIVTAAVQRGGTSSQIPPARIGHAADRAMTTLYARHYRSLVRLAVLLVWDLPAAEEIVQDSFVALYRGRRKPRDGDWAVSYLHRSVVNRSRSATRCRIAAPEHTPMPPPSMPAAQQDTVPPQPAALAVALRALPGHHREVLVLRYYADLPESQVGAALGISTAAVSRRLAQAMSSLQAVLPTADLITASCPPSREGPAAAAPQMTALQIWRNHWTSQPTPLKPVHSAPSLNGVSCRSATACTAVDWWINKQGNALTGRRS